MFTIRNMIRTNCDNDHKPSCERPDVGVRAAGGRGRRHPRYDSNAIGIHNQNNDDNDNHNHSNSNSNTNNM